MKLKKCLFTFLLGLCVLSPLHAQLREGQDASTPVSWSLKSNLLYDLGLTVNWGVEAGLSSQGSMDVSGNFCGWNAGENRRWRHWMVQPEYRHWFCDRFAGHFVGLHLHGGQYNWGGLAGGIDLLGTDWRKLKDSRYQGWFAGGGLAYGYAWILGRHWNLEGELGLGYSYVRYDRFRCAGCGKKLETGKTHHYVGPTKAAVNLVYVF